MPSLASVQCRFFDINLLIIKELCYEKHSSSCINHSYHYDPGGCSITTPITTHSLYDCAIATTVLSS